MSDLRIGIINSSVLPNTQNVSVPVEKKETKKEIKLSNATKYTLGGLTALGVLSAAIYAIRKGQAAKAIKEIGIDKFKEAGNKFVKGKAIGKDGKPFSGIITQIGKDGLKRNIEYQKGVIKEVKTFKPSLDSNGKSYDIPISKKTYNYNSEGKLESIDKFVTKSNGTKTLRTNETEFTRTAFINLDEKRAEGLRKYAEKQARIKEYIETTRQQLSQKREVNASSIDNYFNNYETKNSDLKALQEKYQTLEQKEQNIKQNVFKLKEEMHKKSEINSDKIDKQFETKNTELDELNKQYKQLEEEAEAEAKRLAEKQAKKEEWQKFAAEYPEEAAKIKAEKKAAQKAAEKAKKEEITKANTRFAENYEGETIKIVKSKNKDGSVITRQYTEDGKTLLKEIRETRDGKTIETTYSKELKTTVINDEYGNMTTKLSAKNKNGNYELIQRETVNINDRTSKLVEQLEDGTSKTTVSNDYEKVVTIRDKKGNIISEERFNKYNPEPPKPAEVKVLASWYQEYLRLCKKYGVQPRICGVKGGAWDHFYELNLRETNPEAYQSYIRIREYRARYDETARIMQALDNNVIGVEALEEAQQLNSFENILNQVTPHTQEQANIFVPLGVLA